MDDYWKLYDTGCKPQTMPRMQVINHSFYMHVRSFKLHTCKSCSTPMRLYVEDFPCTPMHLAGFHPSNPINPHEILVNSIIIYIHIYIYCKIYIYVQNSISIWSQDLQKSFATPTPRQKLRRPPWISSKWCLLRTTTCRSRSRRSIGPRSALRAEQCLRWEIHGKCQMPSRNGAFDRKIPLEIQLWIENHWSIEVYRWETNL